MSGNHIGLGRCGEEMAAAFLQKRGYRVLERNYRCPLGEIDLIVCKGGVLAFVEVKTKASAAFAPPQLSVTAAKRRRLVRLAWYFLKERQMGGRDCRFDVVAVVLPDGGKQGQIEHLVDAFRADGDGF